MSSHKNNKDKDDDKYGSQEDSHPFLSKYNNSHRNIAETTDQAEAAANQDIERMALALAPQVAELEDILRDMPGAEGYSSNSNPSDIAANTSLSMELEDDDMDDEIHNLEMSEQLLREELEFAQSFGADMMSMGSPIKKSEEDAVVSNEAPPQEEEEIDIDEDDIHSDIAVTVPTSPVAYTLQHHAEHLYLSTEKMGGWYYCDMTRYVMGKQSQSQPPNPLIIKEYCLPVPYRKLKRLYCGLSFHDVSPPPTPPLHKTPTKQQQQQQQQQQQTISSPSPPATPPGSGDKGNNDERTSISSSPQQHPPPPTPTLTPSVLHQEEPLPFRTLSIQIRPDVLCGAVMDAISHSLEMLPHPHVSRIIKRQGGHLRGAVSVTVNVNNTKHNHNQNPTSKETFSYVCDAQLCTCQSDINGLERRLVIRLYHIQDDLEAAYELAQTMSQHNSQHSSPQSQEEDFLQDYQEPNPKLARISTRHLKQCCSLIQRLMAQQQQESKHSKSKSTDGKSPNNNTASWLGLQDTAFSSKRSMQQAIGQHLESHYKKCPSVRDENKKLLSPSPTRRLTLPCLSAKDYPMVLQSWTLVANLVEELSTRDCTWNTLSSDNNNNNDDSNHLPFGQFPSLPTLDVHYCSQLRRLSREAMITQLLKSAKELEDYAKAAEYNCANLITLVDPMMHYYQIPSVALPTPKPLQDYPLEFTPPQVSCPPWGQPVMEALNRVAALTPTGDINATQATNRVYAAFTKQDDGEQGARLGRKNTQVMERLSNMQSHQRRVIHAIRDACGHSQAAQLASDEFLVKAQAARNLGKEGHPRRLLAASVPLLTFRISVGASLSGTCYITANQMLFNTSYIPLVGGTKTTLLDLRHIGFYHDESVASTLLNPFPNTFFVTCQRKTIFSFRPSLGAKRLHNFLTNLQSFQDDATDFAQPDQIVVQDEEGGVFRLADSVSEDQLSI